MLRGPRNPDPLFARRAKRAGVVSLETASVLHDLQNPRSVFDRAHDPPNDATPRQEFFLLGAHWGHVASLEETFFVARETPHPH